MRVVRYHIAGLLHSPRFPRDWVVMILFYFEAKIKFQFYLGQGHTFSKAWNYMEPSLGPKKD